MAHDNQVKAMETDTFAAWMVFLSVVIVGGLALIFM